MYKSVAYIYLSGSKKYPDWSSTELVQIWVGRDYGKRYLPILGPFLYRESAFESALEHGFTHARGPGCHWDGIQPIPKEYAAKVGGTQPKDLKQCIKVQRF